MNSDPGAGEKDQGEETAVAHRRVESAGGLSLAQCRFGGCKPRLTLADLAETPLANSFVNPAHPDTLDVSYPLHTRVCECCYLVQVVLGISQIKAFEALA